MYEEVVRLHRDICHNAMVIAWCLKPGLNACEEELLERRPRELDCKVVRGRMLLIKRWVKFEPTSTQARGVLLHGTLCDIASWQELLTLKQG